MLSGNAPFTGDDDTEILKNVKKGKFLLPSKDWDAISNEAKDLIRKMITLDVNSRLSAREAINHPWLHNAIRVPLDQTSTIRIMNNLRTFH